MANAQKTKTRVPKEKLSVRIPGGLKEQLDATNRTADITTIALEDFFAKYRTQDAIIECVVRFTTSKASKEKKQR